MGCDMKFTPDSRKYTEVFLAVSASRDYEIVQLYVKTILQSDMKENIDVI